MSEQAEQAPSCFLWFHDWSRWHETERGPVRVNGGRAGYFIQQERACLRCGKKQLHITTDTLRGKV